MSAANSASTRRTACITLDQALLAWTKDFKHLPSYGELPSGPAESKLAQNDTDGVAVETALEGVRAVLPAEGREKASSVLAITIRVRAGIRNLMGATSEATILPAMSQLSSARDEFRPAVRALEGACGEEGSG
jgi:hypothetical protein